MYSYYRLEREDAKARYGGLPMAHSVFQVVF